MEDAIDAFSMIFAGGQSWLPSWLIVYTLSVGLCFYSGMYTTFQPNEYIPQYHSGITVTKQMSGTARAVIAQVRRGKSLKRGLWKKVTVIISKFLTGEHCHCVGDIPAASGTGPLQSSGLLHLDSGEI